MHTHANAAQQITPGVRDVVDRLLAAGLRDVRNQAVLLHGVNDTPAALLDLCFALLDGASIMPYYVYLADMVPSSEHWRTSVGRAQELQHLIMGYLPGFATPRLVCDVPLAGKRWVDQSDEYDRVRGISTWSKNFLTGLESGDDAFCYYDPVHTLPPEGQAWWRQHTSSNQTLQGGR